MTKDEFEAFKVLKEKFEDEIIKLFHYIKDNYVDVLAFGRFANYHHYSMDDEMIRIEYFDDGYDLYDSDDIDIPIKDFLSDPFEWADNWANGKRIKEQEEKCKAIRAQEEEEKRELQRLKDKYEK